MLRSEKQEVVAELAERLRSSDTLIVADYRGLTTAQVDALRTTLLQHGAQFHVVKNTLTRIAAREAGNETLLALLEGPSAIAFIDAGGDPVAVAKAISDTARTTRILAVRGGVLQGRAMSAAEVDELARLPALDVLRGQVLGAVAAPLLTIVGLFTAPLRDLVGLIDARIEQLQAEGGTQAASGASGSEPQAPEASAAPAEEPVAEPPAEEPAAEAAAEEPVAGAAPEQAPEDVTEEE